MEMRMQLWLWALALILHASALGAQTTAIPSATVPSKLTGIVLDSSGGVMPLVDVKVIIGDGVVVGETITNDDGFFELNLPPAEYELHVLAPDFTPHREFIRLIPDMGILSVTLRLAMVVTAIDVGTESTGPSVVPESSLANDIITGDALLDLPNNPDELRAYLARMAGLDSDGDPDDFSGFVIDGFAATEDDFLVLPPTSEIAEVRVVRDAASAERGGRPRVEIVTRDGSGTWRGRLQGTFGDSAFNAANPRSDNKPRSQQRNLTTTLTVPPVLKVLNFSLTARNNESENEGNTIAAETLNGPVNESVISLNRSRTLTFQPTWTISQNHRLTANFTYSSNRRQNNGIGRLTLAERAATNERRNWNLQVTERATLGTVVNEVRMRIQSDRSSNVPVMPDTMAIQVVGAFNGGGAPNRSQTKRVNLLLSNTVRWQYLERLDFTMGAQLDSRKDQNHSADNYVGTYRFATLEDYRSGRPSQFTQTAGDPYREVSQSEFSAWFEGQWRTTPKLNVTFGARYQLQQHVRDYNNIAPNLGLAYQLNTNRNWRSVLRFGASVSHPVVSMNIRDQIVRNDGSTRQFQIQILNPSYPFPYPTYPDPFADDSVHTRNMTAQLYVRANDFVAPYVIQPSMTFDQNMAGGTNISVRFHVQHGLHQTRTRNINAPYPGTPIGPDLQARLQSPDSSIRNLAREEIHRMRPSYPVVSNIIQVESSGRSLSKNFSLQFRTQNHAVLRNTFVVGGNVMYTLRQAYDDGSLGAPDSRGGGGGQGGGRGGRIGALPMNNYDLSGEWARSDQPRHEIRASLDMRLPWAMRASFQNVTWTSGRPYTITLGQDRNADGSNNDRPFIHPVKGEAGDFFHEGGFPLTRNSQTGPGTLSAITLNFTKRFLIPRQQTPAPSLQRGGDGRSPSPQNGQRQMELTMRVNNLLNSTIRTNINGVMTSPIFGELTGGGRGRSITLGLNMDLF